MDCLTDPDRAAPSPEAGDDRPGLAVSSPTGPCRDRCAHSDAKWSITASIFGRRSTAHIAPLRSRSARPPDRRSAGGGRARPPTRRCHAARGGRRALSTSGGRSSVMATLAGAQRCGNSRSLSPTGRQSAAAHPWPRSAGRGRPGGVQAARLALAHAHQPRNIAPGHHTEQHRLLEEWLHPRIEPNPSGRPGTHWIHLIERVLILGPLSVRREAQP